MMINKFLGVITSVIVFLACMPVAASSGPTLTVTNSGTSVNLSWTTIPGDIGYSLLYTPYPYSGLESIVAVDIGSQNSLSINLWEGAAFYVAIQSTSTFGTGGYSNVELIQIAEITSKPPPVSGSYKITNTVDATSCGEGIYTYSAIFSFQQVGNAVTVSGVDYDGNRFVLDGTITNDTIQVSGSYKEDAGTTRLTAHLTLSGNSFNGNISWTWSNRYVSCSGTDVISGIKQ